MENGSPDLDSLGVMIDEGENAYEILGLPRNASGDEIREAYIRLAKKYHPDTHPDDLTAERRFKRITGAYLELRSSFYLRGPQFRQPPRFWASYKQLVAIVLFFMLAPAAILIATRGQEEFPPSLQIGQRSVSSPGTEDTGPSTAAQERSTGPALVLQTAAAPHDPPEATPAGSACGVQAPSSHQEAAGTLSEDPVVPMGRNDEKKLASVQAGTEDGPVAVLEPQAPVTRKKVSLGTAGKTSASPSKTVNAASTSTTGRNQTMRSAPDQSTRATRVEHSLDRAVLAAAPGG